MVGFETRTDAQETRLFAHLVGRHRELVGNGGSRWAGLLEHFFVVPNRYLASPRVFVIQT